MGRNSFCRVSDDIHYPNIYAMVVGKSGVGKKGMAWSPCLKLMKLIDQPWAENAIHDGFGSGEAIIARVSDKRGPDGLPNEKRCLIKEKEFANLLSIMERNGSTISGIIRNGFDGGKISSLVKSLTESLTATDAHMSVLGDITPFELRMRMAETNMMNGFANRNLCCTELPGSGVCGALLDGNAATGLTKHHIGPNPNGVYTWEFNQCLPRPKVFELVTVTAFKHRIGLTIQIQIVSWLWSPIQPDFC